MTLLARAGMTRYKTRLFNSSRTETITVLHYNRCYLIRTSSVYWTIGSRGQGSCANWEHQLMKMTTLRISGFVFIFSNKFWTKYPNGIAQLLSEFCPKFLKFQNFLQNQNHHIP